MKLIKQLITLLVFSSALLVPTGCESKFDVFEESPNWLGPNIYDYLAGKGNYSIYLKLIDDCGYKETMQKTGSVTLFVADDAAFARFFADNDLGISSYENMPEQVKYMILRSGLLTNAYLTEKLSTTENGNQGQIIRRTTALQNTDVIPFVNGDNMPDTKYWSKYKGKSFPLLQDGSEWTLLHFTDKSMDIKAFSNQDFEFITGKPRIKGDVFLFDVKVKEKDIACKNGYVNVLEDVYVPPVNMSQFIRTNSSVSKFNHLMDRFCAPYFHSIVYNLTTQTNDSLFQLRYFNSGVNALTKEPDARGLANGATVDATLLFDPSWNKIQTSSGANLFGYDMPAMFVPTNEAMDSYFSATGNGNDLFDEFKTWDNVPNTIAADFISNHMKKSFLTALPGQFEVMKDESGYLMNVKKENIVSSKFTRNGLIYTINKVLPPLDYRTVIGPVKINSTTSIFQKGQSDTYTKFIYYFRSLLNTYSYFATLDVNMNDYRDPVAQGYTAAKKEIWKFKIVNGSIQAVAKKAAGDSVTITDGRIAKRLTDIFDLQTIVGEINPGQEYYITKGGGAVRVKGNVITAANGQKMFTEGTTIEGGGNIERGNKVTIIKNYSKENGCTYFIDGILENPVTSVFGQLQSNPKFSRFLELCNQSDIFISLVTANSKALNNKVKFFDLFHYTVYVPTNEALDAVIGTSVLPSQTQIDNAETVEQKAALELKRLRFLRYHFQDNSIFIGGEPNSNKAFLSATLNNSTGKFYPLYVTNSSSALTVRDYKGNIAHVLNQEKCFNLMARDIVLNTNNTETATEISTSSMAVVHLIDNVLRFE